MKAASTYNKERNDRLFKAGLCRVCAKHERIDGKTRCADCAKRASEALKRRRRRLLKKNTCPVCSRRPIAKNRTACRTCLKKESKRAKSSYVNNKDTVGEKRREHTKAVRLQVFAAYGGAVCRCCGEDQYVFLTLDHINNDGAAHRRQVGRGLGVFRWLKKNGFPPGYQVLCWCCNAARKLVGVCPHQNGVDSGRSEPDVQ